MNRYFEYPAGPSFAISDNLLRSGIVPPTTVPWCLTFPCDYDAIVKAFNFYL